MCLLNIQLITAQNFSDKNFTDTLAEAEAKYRAQEWVQSAVLWKKVTSENPVNGRFWNRLAYSYWQIRDYKNAIAAYEKVLELKEGFPSDAAYNIACGYALLGEKEKAINWLEKAFKLGFRNLGRAQTDEDLLSLRSDKRFREIVALVDTGKMTCVEGWRYDLNLLAREVKRKGYSPFEIISEQEFDREVKKISSAIPNLSDMQIYLEMTKLIEKVGDGHSWIGLSHTIPELQQTLPVKFYLFEEGLFIIAAAPRHKDLLGAQVLNFGGKSIAEIFEGLESTIPRDNEIWIKARAPYSMRSLHLLHVLGLIPDAKKISLEIKDFSGRRREVILTTDTEHPNIWNTQPNPPSWVNLAETLPQPTPLYLKNMSARYWFEYLPKSKTVYFQYNNVINDPGEPFPRFVERLDKFINENEVEKLVIDMRWNNGGNTFLNEPLLHALIRNNKINRRGKLFVIIGRRTFSAAQNSVSYFERHLNPIFVGEPTGGRPNAAGDEVPFTLPYSQITANVSDLYWAGGWATDYRTWIAPLLYTPPTFVMFRTGRDPAMETILNYHEPSR